MSDVRENLTYEQFGAAVRELAQTVADDGYEPDVVLSIARGGVFVAGGLAYALDCKNIHLVNVEFYTGVGTTLDMPVMLAPVPNVIDFSDKKVLITDDVAARRARGRDSGRRLDDRRRELGRGRERADRGGPRPRLREPGGASDDGGQRGVRGGLRAAAVE
ncbi:phosphoribosyltransferase, partial [Streptomyces olivaceus]